nr:reverse transcriptase domain-containing protein [Tanacetum cinerariifolium]
MEKVRHDRRKDVHTRLDFGEGPRERTREDSHHSSAIARATKPEWVKVHDRLRYGDCHETNSRDPPRGRSRARGLSTSREDHPKDRERFCSVGESYDDSFSHSYHDGNRSLHMKRIRDNKSSLSSESRGDSSDGRYRRSGSKRRKPTDEDDLTKPWMCEEEDSFTPQIRNFESSQRTRMPNNVKTCDGTRDPEDHVKNFHATAQVERCAMPTWCHMFNSTLIGAARKYVKVSVEIHNIKQKDGETIEDFMERFKVETGRMKGAPECKLSHLIKEIKHGRDQSKTRKNETASKDKPTTIYMIQSWQKTTRKKVTQSFERVKEITFPPLAASSRTEGPLVIEVEMGGYMIHRMYVDGGSSMEILYEHCFNRLWPEIKSQMVPTTTSLTGFSGETIWPLGQLRLLVIVGDTIHSTRAWMNLMIVRSLSPYNGIIRRPGIRAIQAVPEERTRPANFKAALHPDFPDQEVAIRETLSDKRRTELCSILKKNLDIFAWQPSDMTGVPQGPKTSGGRDHERGLLPRLAVQPSHEPNEEKTTFHTGQGVCCYTKMPFGLKNTGATYQRLMDKDFESQIGRNIEVYIDDLVVKSHTEDEMMRDIEETFRTLRKILADFLFEMPGENPQAEPAAEIQQKPWTLFTDGSSCVDRSGAGLILTNPEGIEFTYTMRFQFVASNKEAEYEALIACLRIAARMGVKDVHVSVDSKLVANQVLETYVAKEDNMVKYLEIVKSLVSGFTTFSISQVPRSKNKKADALSKIASTSFAHLSKQVLVEILKDKSIKEKEVTTVIEEDRPTWMTPIVDYLNEGTLPGDKKEARKLRLKARQYELIEGTLYRRSFLTPWLRCVGPLQAEYVMREIHEGSCSMHARPRLLYEVDRSEGGGDNHRRIEIRMPTYCTAAVDVVSNVEELRLNLDLLEKWRERTTICEAKAKLKMTKYYNARVRGVTFKPGDFVYRSNDASHAVAGGKLGPKREGPYEVTEALGDEAYKLRSRDETILPSTWNIANLKRCYL